MERENKKLLILQILKVLKENSSDNQPITQTEIGKILEKDGISCDRKTISRNIDYLKEFGFNIVKIAGGGCYYIDDTFDESELTFLVDCIYSSPAISQKQAIALIEKLTANIGYKDKKRFENIYKVDEITRTDNKQVFYNIEQINYAIQNNHKISFYYNKYGMDKKLAPRKLDKYIINPYFTINSKGKYFLVCNKDNYSNLSNYRIDYITCVDVLEDTTIKPIKETTGNKNGVNPIKYANEHIYMFAGETVKAKLKLTSDRVVSDIIDWFGKNVKLTKENDVVFATLEATEQALIYWCLQYGKDVEIIEPYLTRKKFKEELKTIVQKYKDEV